MMVALLMSYPRSGSHLTRALLEAKSGQPTLGCIWNPEDTPIRDRFTTGTAPFPRLSDEPVAQKVHEISEDRHIRNNGPTVDRMCLIVRDPARCIISQIHRGADGLPWLKRYRTKYDLRKPHYVAQQTDAELTKWTALLDHYIASDLPKLALSFEALTSENRLSEVNDRLLPFFGIDQRFESLEELDHVGSFGSESQQVNVKKLPEEFYNRFQKNDEHIRSVIDYDALCRRIGAT